RNHLAYRDNHQRCLVLQALPEGGTPQRPIKHGLRSHEEEHLQPWRPGRHSLCLQPPLSRPSRRSTISQLALGCWTVSPGRGRLRARPSRGSISSTPPNAPCLVHYRTPSSISLVSAAPISPRCWSTSRLRRSRAGSAACAALVSSSALPKPTATTSPAPEEPSSLPPLTSLNTASFPHSPDAF